MTGVPTCIFEAVWGTYAATPLTMPKSLLGLLLLLATAAFAQQPTALPGAPQPGPAVAPTAPPPASLPTTLAATSAPAVAPTPALPGTEIIGQSYSVELRSGPSFIGVLQVATAESLTFTTKDLGSVTVQRANLRQLTQLSAEQARRGYDDVGNGNRLLFAPTARNLRRGEGYVQSAYVVLVAVDYGVTDYFSIGTLFTFVPSAGSDNFFSLTPKLSAPVAHDLRVGAGAVLGVTSGGTFGVTYGNATYGSADNNLTVGLGYGFAGSAFSSTPVFVLGGATRVSRRVSLLNETYIFHTEDDYSRDNLVAGIAGVRLAGQRLGGSLGILYLVVSHKDKNYGYYGSSSSDSDGGAVPYAEVSYRFGKIK